MYKENMLLLFFITYNELLKLSLKLEPSCPIAKSPCNRWLGATYNQHFNLAVFVPKKANLKYKVMKKYAVSTIPFCLHTGFPFLAQYISLWNLICYIKLVTLFQKQSTKYF